MATGWAELLKWMRRRFAADELDQEATWARFQKLAARSEHADILRHIVRVGRVLPNQERHRLAVATTRLLAPVEWPPEWSGVRPGLTGALETLVDETNPEEDGSFFALHDLGSDAELQRVGHLVLRSALDLLVRPCRRDELRVAASLCNIGNAACLLAYRKAIRRAGSDGLINHDARARYRSAFEGYAEAARALNGAVGAVLFEGLDARVP